MYVNEFEASEFLFIIYLLKCCSDNLHDDPLTFTVVKSPADVSRLLQLNHTHLYTHQPGCSTSYALLLKCITYKHFYITF